MYFAWFKWQSSSLRDTIPLLRLGYFQLYLRCGCVDNLVRERQQCFYTNMSQTSISQFFILSPRGDTLISRDYRADVPKSSAATLFRTIKFWEGGDAPPCFTIDKVHYIYVKSNNLILAATSKFNVSPSMLLELLNRIGKVCKDYLGILNEESIRKNFILVYELLDEMLDFGYPQGTSTESLKGYIYNEAVMISQQVRKGAGSKMGKKTKHSSAVNQPIALSRTRDKKRRNEIFVDILERLTVTFNSTGTIISSEIDGRIQMKSYLSGNPQLRLALNPDLIIGKGGGNYGGVALDDANFHECANLDDFEDNRTMVISPPEGEFVVMNYRVSGDFHAPFRVFPFVENMSEHRLELVVKVRADMDVKSYGSNVKVRFPVPRTTGTVSTMLDKTGGPQNCEYRDKQKEVVWNIEKFMGGTEHTLVTKITLIAPCNASTRKEIGPISLDFEIPMYNSSNLKVKYLRINAHASYKPLRWVRYVTQAASYICRT